MKLIRIHCHSETGGTLTWNRVEIHPDLLAAYEEMGIVEISGQEASSEQLHRLQKILRLKNNCGVNTIGAAIIVDLLDRIENLQDEVKRLQRKW